MRLDPRLDKKLGLVQVKDITHAKISETFIHTKWKCLRVKGRHFQDSQHKFPILFKSPKCVK